MTQKRKTNYIILGLAILLVLLWVNAFTEPNPAVSHGISISSGFGMVNTLNDGGASPDSATYTLDVDYFRLANTKSDILKTYLKTGLEWMTSFNSIDSTLMDLEGIGANLDGGIILWNIWRLGIGASFNYSIKQAQGNVGESFTISPYFETSVFWKAFEHSGFDFGFRIFFPIDVAGQDSKPYFNIHGKNALGWDFSVAYVVFLG